MLSRLFICCLFLASLPTPIFAQDLEPRRWSPVPLDVDIVGIGYGYSASDIAYDPVYQVENAQLKLHVIGANYITSFKLADKLVRFDVKLPWANGEWDGLLQSKPGELKRIGMLDPVFRLSVNLIGSPALESKKLRRYLQSKSSNTIVGAALSVTAPWGEYHHDRLINLGHNRYNIRPQIGMVHTRGAWQYELTGSVSIFTDNNSFHNGKLKQQKPLFAIQSHLIRTFERGKWLSISAGYGVGGQTKVDQVEQNDKKHTILSALSFGMPISMSQSVRIAYLYQQTNSDVGADSDALLLGWSQRF
ncbi:transporter [Thalassotalea sp. PLHSN55]|uniref:transporter n=1 Tax=Thalassotalea sp. PLHSN55 TaxID=3435888 RepID=UPI003F847B14